MATAWRTQASSRSVCAALIQALERTGDGRTAATALKVISIREEYVWLNHQRQVVKPKSRALKPIDGKYVDVWTVVTTAGETELYFDFTAMADSRRRIEATRR